MASRVAKNPIQIPAGVEVKLVGQEVLVKGKLGELKKALPSLVKLEQIDGHVKISAANDTQESDAQSGTIRAIVQNMVSGVSTGFIKELTLVGVGYRAKVQGHSLDISVGYSHPVVMALPKGITAECPSNTEIVLKGADKHVLAQFAANVRAVRSPEPYKGKGIRYKNERIILKEGKKK